MAAEYLYAVNVEGPIDVSMHHAAIVEAIKNGGQLDEDLADIFVLTKTPAGSAAQYVLTFA